MVETKPINKNSRRIFVPDRIFSCTSNGRLEIRGIFTDEQGNSAKSILIKIGHRTIACEQYQEGEFGISFSVSKGYKLLRVIAMTEKGKCVTIGTRIVKGGKGICCTSSRSCRRSNRDIRGGTNNLKGMAVMDEQRLRLSGSSLPAMLEGSLVA